ncbi:MAG: TIGR03619 family F420-dependent LLM class oxidoreductase [Chloroflexota bacterium]
MSGHSLPTVGLFSVNFHVCAGPNGSRIAALAEKLGYDSVWAGEHVVLPRPRVAPSPMDPDDPILDPIVALSNIAAATKNVRLGTGIIILPQRNPVVLAKQLASLDVISGGRLIFGMGVGYLEPELRAIGVPVDDRIAMSHEYLAAMRSLWHDTTPQYHGKFVDFAGVDAFPRPAQHPLPVVMGGHTVAAHRRAAQRADGWYGFWQSEDQATSQVKSLRAQEARAKRKQPLHVSISPNGRLSKERVERYAELGVDRLIVVPPPKLSIEQLEEFVEANAPGNVGATPAAWM